MPLAVHAEATDRLVRDLDDPVRWAPAAATLTAELGFRVIEPDRTGHRGGATEGHLLVALREAPTLRHFDPEVVSYYGPAPEGAAPAALARLPTGAAVEATALWGHVHVVDRIPVENRFLTFGGTLDARGVDASLTIVHLRSPAPIVRWGGRSQGTDALTLAIGAFFGRLLVPVDFLPGAARRIDAAPPKVLFAAFLCDTVRRAAGRRRLLGEPSELDQWLGRTWARTREDGLVRVAAETLLADIGF
ncbi:MAG TPA: hypothetical protein VJ850_07450 [Candidatus Limnocylindrales bacterium]|nr:hypothetical protein [Candidatus Limnocylindrales bacterium]